MNPISSRLILGALALATWCVSPAQSSQQDDAGFQHFITRKDNKLYDGDKAFRFAGANMPGTDAALRLHPLPAGAA